MRSSICIRAATHPKGEVRKNYYNDLGGFNTALFRTRLDEITKLFSADTNNQFAIGDASRGLAGDIVKQVSDYLASTGILASRGTSYSAITASVLKEQTNLDLKMEAAEARYTKQFSTMNKIMEEMNSMQDYLSSQLENLPFTAKND